MTTETDSNVTTESTQMSRRQGWFLVGALMLLALLLFFVDFSTPQAEPRQVEAVAGFQPLAKLTEVEMSFAPGLGEDTAVFIGTLTPGSDHQLTAIDYTTRELKWEVTGSDQFRPYFWLEEWFWAWPFRWEWGPLVTLDDKVVVADAFMLTTSINSFDMTTGDMGWQRQIGSINGSNISYLAELDDEIALRISVDGYSQFQIREKELGTRQFQRMSDAGNIFWAEQEPELVFEAFANQIRVTGEGGWQQAVSGCDVQPIVLADMVVVKTNGCTEEDFTGEPGIFALLRTNGSVLWQMDQEVVSNLAVDGTHVVGLTADAHLIVIDAANGAVLSSLPFSPLKFGEGRDFFVAIRGDIIAIYFGDSHELFFVSYQ